jgi:hypothetical protein
MPVFVAPIDIANVFEDFSEDALARGLSEGLVDGSAVLRDLRKVEQATGMELLPPGYGIDPAAGEVDTMPLLEGFSKLARAHAWGNVRTGALPERTARWMDMLVATQAGMLRKAENSLIRSDLARAGQFKEALAKGEVPAELEKLLGESIGIGREPAGPAAEVKTEVDAGGAINNPAPAGLARLLGSFSVGEDDRGSRRRDEFVHKVWSALAQHDELFQYKRTTSKDAVDIAKAVSLPGMEVIAYRDGNSIFFHGKRGYVEIMDPDSERPYISSPRAKSQGVERGGGSQLYVAALDWIHNNDKKVADDPDGISPINAIRRTSNFFASALRWGTTKHLEPHADQQVDGWGDDETTNFAGLSRREMENAFAAVPEARDWTFNFTSGRFEHGDGRAVTGEEIATAVAGGRPGESGIGLSTLQRAVLTASTLQELERGRPADALESAASPVLDSALEGLSYSIGPVPSFIQPLESGTQSHERNTREENLRNPARILAGLEGRSGEDERRIGEGLPLGDEPRGSLRADGQKRRKSGREVVSASGILAWAEAQGRVLEASRIDDLADEDSPRGGEHLVIPDPATGRVVKLTKPGLFGAQAEDAGAYLERWALHNIVFSDDVAFEGLVTFAGEDRPRAVISQKFAGGRDATPEEQSEYLKGKGFHEVETGRWVHPVRGVVVWDTITPGNCIMTAEGVKVIDLQIGLATTEEIEEVRRQTGIGKRSSF